MTAALLAAPLWAQSWTVQVAGDALHLRGSGLRLIDGVVADHLKEGRAVGVEVTLVVLEKPGGATITQTRQAFNLSFDLWEQRYAVSRAGTPPRSISHLTARDAEGWVLENASVTVAALGRAGRDLPFWIRLTYRVQDRVTAANPEDDSPFTLQTLIDVLSRRRPDAATGRSFELGPFRLGR
jgi:hypothetical protein